VKLEAPNLSISPTKSNPYVNQENTASFSRSFMVPALCFSFMCKFKDTDVS
jgi:hypothetical protein